MLKPQSIRKGMVIYLNGKEIDDKQEIIDLSKTWNENQIEFFKKMLKQGGNVKIKGDSINIKVVEKVVNSMGEKEVKGPQIPTADTRF